LRALRVQARVGPPIRAFSFWECCVLRDAAAPLLSMTKVCEH
jgi:hypothetical protein